MPRKCTVCEHPQIEEINRLLVTGESSKRRIAADFSLSESSVHRHASNHLPARMIKSQEAAEVTQADDLVRHARALLGKAMGILIQAENAGDLRAALHAIREARGCLELQAKLLGELNEQQTTVNVLVTSPEWITTRGALMNCLEPYPEARAAVAVALGGDNHHAGA